MDLYPTDVRMPTSVLVFGIGLDIGGCRRAPSIIGASFGKAVNLRRGSGVSRANIGGVFCGCFSITLDSEHWRRRRPMETYNLQVQHTLHSGLEFSGSCLVKYVVKPPAMYWPGTPVSIWSFSLVSRDVQDVGQELR